MEFLGQPQLLQTSPPNLRQPFVAVNSDPVVRCHIGSRTDVDQRQCRPDALGQVPQSLPTDAAAISHYISITQPQLRKSREVGFAEESAPFVADIVICWLGNGST